MKLCKIADSWFNPLFQNIAEVDFGCEIKIDLLPIYFTHTLIISQWYLEKKTEAPADNETWVKRWSLLRSGDGNLRCHQFQVLLRSFAMICLLCMIRVCFAEQIPGASLILLVPTSRENPRQSDQPAAWWNTTWWLEFPAQMFTWQWDLQVEQVSGANGASNTDLNTINENQQNVKRTGRCAIDLVSFVGLILFTYSSSLYHAAQAKIHHPCLRLFEWISNWRFMTQLWFIDTMIWLPYNHSILTISSTRMILSPLTLWRDTTRRSDC